MNNIWNIKVVKLCLILVTSGLTNSHIALAKDRYPDDQNVSSLRGQLVEVGDKHRFHNNFPKINLSANPFGILYGSYAIAGSVALADNVAVRANYTYVEPEINEVHGYELGITAPIYFRKMYTGMYLEPGLALIENKSSNQEDRSRSFGPQILLGYSWFWDSGWNIAVAAGLGRNLLHKKSDYEDKNRIFGNGYLQVGYAF